MLFARFFARLPSFSDQRIKGHIPWKDEDLVIDSAHSELFLDEAFSLFYLHYPLACQQIILAYVLSTIQTSYRTWPFPF